MGVGEKTLRQGSVTSAIGAALMLGASIAIVSRDPDPATRAGRHLWAGILAEACLSFVEIVIVWIPLRQGEKWAFWAYLLPLIFQGGPVLALDTLHVPRGNHFATLMP